MNPENASNNGGADAPGGTPPPKPSRVVPILIALVLAVPIVWAWHEYGQPGLKSLIKALLSD